MPHSKLIPLFDAPWRTCLLMFALLLFFNPAWAQASAGTVMSVSGNAKAIDTQGGERPLQKDAEVFAGDKIITGETTLVQMRMRDGGYLSVRASTEMVIDQFVHNEKDSSKSSFLVSLLRGGFRSITGLIGRNNPNGYQIRSATATIGIRGTDHEPMVVEQTPGMSALTPPGLYDKVNEGATFIRNKGGTLYLKGGEVGFASMSPELAPQLLLKVPDFYKVPLKVDAQGPQDGADDKPDGSKRAGTGGTLLRPALATRREALSSPDGKAPAATNAPLLTPEQKKAIGQIITAPVQKNETAPPPATPQVQRNTGATVPLQK